MFYQQLRLIGQLRYVNPLLLYVFICFSVRFSIFTIRSISSSDKPEEDLIVIACSLPVPKSLARTFTIPFYRYRMLLRFEAHHEEQLEYLLIGSDPKSCCPLPLDVHLVIHVRLLLVGYPLQLRILVICLIWDCSVTID